MKKFFLFLSIGIMMITLNSCKNDKNAITVLGESSASLNTVEDIKHKYTRLTGDSIITIGFSLEESLEKANVDFANGKGQYDIIMQYNFSLSSFVRNNYVYDLQDLNKDGEAPDFESDLFPNAWEELGYYYKNPNDPKSGFVKVGYPFASNTILLAYNKDMFEKAENRTAFKQEYGYELNPPTTYSQFYDIAKFFTNKKNNTYGVCLQGSTGGWLYFEWAMISSNFGGGVMEKTRGWEGDLSTPFIMTNNNTIKATEFYLGLKPFNKGDFFNVDAIVQATEILEGNVAMAFVWSDYLYSDFYDNKDNKFDSRFGFVPVPGEASPIAGGAYFINKKSKKPIESYNFIKWLLQKDNQIEMLKRGLSSPRRSVYDSPEVQDIPYVKPLKESIERGIYMFEAGPDSELINDRVTVWMQKAWRGEVSAKDALENAQKEIQAERKKIFENIK